MAGVAEIPGCRAALAMTLLVLWCRAGHKNYLKNVGNDKGSTWEREGSGFFSITTLINWYYRLFLSLTHTYEIVNLFFHFFDSIINSRTWIFSQKSSLYHMIAILTGIKLDVLVFVAHSQLTWWSCE